MLKITFLYNLSNKILIQMSKVSQISGTIKINLFIINALKSHDSPFFLH